jgi:hypothetical protein
VSNDNAIDRAIEQAARELIAGEPSPAFRVRVMARLGERRGIPRSAWLLSPIAVAAVVLIALSLRTPVSHPPAHEELRTRAIDLIASVPDRPVPLVTPAIEIRRDPTPVAGQSVVAALAPPQLEVPSLVLTEMPVGESIGIPELETIAPITVAPIGDPQGEHR